MTRLHDIAATVEGAAHAGFIEGERLLDRRHHTAEQAAARLRAQFPDRFPASLDETRLVEAVALVQQDYLDVRTSTAFCSAYDANHVRIEHCASGIYLWGSRAGGLTDQRITSIEVNLEPGQGWMEHRSCPVDERFVRPYRHLHVPGWASWPRFSMDGDTVLGLAWELRYTRLGIGRELYTRAANIVPNARWTAGALFEGSKASRARLHAADPWRWEFGDCRVCGVPDRLDAEPALLWADSDRRELAAAHQVAETNEDTEDAVRLPPINRG